MTILTISKRRYRILFSLEIFSAKFFALHRSRERLIAGWDASDISSRDTFYTILKLISTPAARCNEDRGGMEKRKEKWKREREGEGEREAEDQCCRVIGVYLVGSQNSPTAAPPSLGNFLNPRGDPPACDVFCRFIFSTGDNRWQYHGANTPHLVLLPFHTLFSRCVFSQFISRRLSARLDLSTYKWRSFVRLC